MDKPFVSVYIYVFCEYIHVRSYVGVTCTITYICTCIHGYKWLCIDNFSKPKDTFCNFARDVAT